MAIRQDKQRETLKRKPGQTKFDRWLEQMAKEQKPLRFYFSIPPITQRSTARMVADCTVLEVDKDFLFMEFEDGQCWWVSKEVITACGWPL